MIRSLPFVLEAKVLSYLDGWELIDYCHHFRPIVHRTCLDGRVTYMGRDCVRVTDAKRSRDWIFYDGSLKNYQVIQCGGLVMEVNSSPIKRLRFD